MRTLGRRYLALAVLLVLAAASGRADAELVAHSPTTSFPNRYARNICSLAASTAEEMSECQVGKRVRFGERRVFDEQVGVPDLGVLRVT